MDIETCQLFKQSLLNLMGETIVLRDLIENEIQKYKPFEEVKKEEVINDQFDPSKKINKKVSKPRPVNKIIENVKKEDDIKKNKRATKTKKEPVIIDTTNLTLEI